MAVTTPSPILTAAWCSGASGTKGYITTSIPSSAASPAASLADGFPLTTMQNAGVPMKGADMNGILNWLSQYCLWAQAGGQFVFNSGFASSPGYPAGAVIQLNSGLGAYVNTVAGNTNDPNSVTTNWLPWAGSLMADKVSLAASSSASVGAGMVGYSSAQSYGAGTVGYALLNGAAHYATTTGTNTYAVTIGTGGPYNGQVISFQITTGGGNSGAVTLNLNSTGAVSVVTNKNQALVAGDLLSAAIYTAIYDSTLGKWVMCGLVNSQVHNIGGQSPATNNLTTNSAIGVMAGMKMYFTPVLSGRVMVTINGTANHTASPFDVSVGIYIGTGTAPNAGAASAGGPMTYGGKQFNTVSSATYTSGAPFSLVSYQGNLVIGTQYWFDISANVNTAGTLSLNGMTCMIVET